MPTNRNLRSVAAALLSLALVVILLAACPRAPVDHSTAMAGDPFNVPATMAPGPAPEDLGAERSHAIRASRSRAIAAEEAARAKAIADLAAAKERAERIAAQSAAVMAAPRPVAPAVMDAAFWRRLANCESPTGRSGTYLGYFQFSRDTARKVGWFDGASYDQQQAMAERWLAMIGGPSRGGTRSGWPRCWWVALRG